MFGVLGHRRSLRGSWNMCVVLKLVLLLGGCASFSDPLTTHSSRGDWQREVEATKLRGLNQDALNLLAVDADCEAHVDTVLRLLRRRQNLVGERVYSCPGQATTMASQRLRCHVSVLVTSSRGERWVLDNGTVLPAASSAVALFSEFQLRTKGVYWFGNKPDLFASLGFPVGDWNPVTVKQRAFLRQVLQAESSPRRAQMRQPVPVGSAASAL